MLPSFRPITLFFYLTCFTIRNAAENGNFKCGMESSHTVGTKYTTQDPTGTFTEIEDHGLVSRHLPSRHSEEAFRASRNRRVVHGNLIQSLESFPWIADLSILLDIEGGNGDHVFNFHACGGAIVSEYFIVTAAHCLVKTQELANHSNWSLSLRVTVGEYDQNRTDEFEEDFIVESAVFHENYNFSDILVNDIALIKVKAKNGRGIQFNEHVQPVCLPSANTPYTEGSLVLAGGWGISFTSYDVLSNYSRLPHLGEIPILPVSKCQIYCDEWTNFSMPGHNCYKQGHLCIGHTEGGTDTCNGDSGGPLVQNINGRFTLLAITSFGSPVCGKADYPAVYTNIREYLPWILTNMKTL